MNSSSVIIKNALKLYLAIVLSFFLIKELNFEKTITLRFVIFIFIILATNTTVKENFKKSNRIDLIVGFLTPFYATIALVLSLILYISLIDTDLIETVETKYTLWNKNLKMAIFAVFAEGTIYSIICSLLVTHYWRRYK